MFYPNYTAVPLTRNASVLSALFGVTAKHRLVKIALLSDSRFTNPAGHGDDTIPNLNFAFGLRYGNWPASQLCFMSSNDDPWCIGMAVNPGGGTIGSATRLTAAQVPPNLSSSGTLDSDLRALPVAVVSQGALFVLRPLMEYSVDASLRNGTIMVRAGDSYAADIYAATATFTGNSSGEIYWQYVPNTAAAASFGQATISSGTTAMGLNTSSQSVLGATIPIGAVDDSHWPQMLLNGDGVHPVDFGYLRFKNTTAPNGIVVDTYSAGGYNATSFLTYHASSWPWLTVQNYDAAILWYGANDNPYFTGTQFHDNLVALIAAIRTNLGNATLPIILVGDTYLSANDANYTNLNQYPGACDAIAQADPYSVSVNLRLAGEQNGINAANESPAGLTDKGAWADATPYILNDMVSVTEPPNTNAKQFYKCVSAHTSSAATVPPEAVHWLRVHQNLADGTHYSLLGGEKVTGLLVDLLMGTPVDVGVGASQVTLTFLDGSSAAVPSVYFSVYAGGSIVANARAGTDGTITVGLPDGTYSVVGSPTSGVLFASTPLVVGGTTALTITGSTAAIIPAPPLLNQATVYAYAYEGDGSVPTTGKTFRLVLVGSGTSNDVWSDDFYLSEPSDTTTGLATATAQLGGRYQVSLDGETWSPTFTVNANPFHLAEVVGKFRGAKWR